MDSRDLIKEFEFFCKLSMGEFHIDLFPECRKLDYKMKMEYNIKENNEFEYLLLKLESSKEDFEIITIKNFKLLDIKRSSEIDNQRAISLYSLNIITDKGTLSIKKSNKENKIFIEFISDNIYYKSSVIF